MPEVKYGQLESWEDGDVSSPNNFMQLVEGENPIRIITNPYQFIVHWFNDVTGTKRKIRCAVDDCPLCRKGDRPQCRWFIGVIDRKSNIPKILEISSQIYTGIKRYASNPKWGDVKNYDINIYRGPKNSQPLYSVTVEPKEPLSDSDKETKKSFLEKVDINKFTQPSTPEEILEKIGAPSMDSPKVRYAVGSKVVENSGGSMKQIAKPTVEDDDYDFDAEEEL